MNPIQRALIQAETIIAQDRDLNAPHSVVGTLSTVRRIGNTRNGNGKFRVIVVTENLGEIVLDTSPDSTVAGRIDNTEFRTTPHRFTLNGRGQITHAEVV